MIDQIPSVAADAIMDVMRRNANAADREENSGPAISAIRMDLAVLELMRPVRFAVRQTVSNMLWPDG
jgi:hypothetical protein